MFKIFLISFTLIIQLCAKDLLFNEKEQQYIQKQTPISIGMLNNFKPFSYVENQTHQGLSVDILNEISNISGLQFDIKTSRWSNAYNQFKEGKLQMISGISHNSDREAFTVFSRPFYEIPIFIFGKKSNKTYKNNDSVIGKKVGIGKDMFYKQSLLNMGVEVVEFNSSNEKAKALALGEIDYYLASYTSGVKAINSQFLTSLKPLDEYKAIKKEDLRFGVNKNEPILHSIIEKSLSVISSRKMRALRNKWIVGLKTPELKNLNFTEEELHYLTQYPVIKVHNELEWPPFNYFENGSAQGYSIDYMNLLASKIGLKTQFVTGNWNDLLEKVKNNKIDVMLNIAKSKSREEYLDFTSSYMTTSSVIFVRNTHRNKYRSMQDFRGKKIAVIKGFYQIEFLQEHYPYIEIKIVSSAIEGLKLVAFGEVDGTVLSMSVAEYLNTKYNLANLVPTFELKQSALNLHLATNKNNTILRDILEKGKQQITNNEILRLKQKWLIQTGVEYEKDLNLSTNEKIYLKRKKEINVCINPSLMPFESIQSGEHVGLTSDYFKYLKQKLNVEFKLLPTSSWIHSLESVKNRTCDILSMSLQTDLVKEHLNYTLPYVRLPLVVATKINVPFISSLDQLNNKSIGILNSNTKLNKLKMQFPDIKLIPYSSSKEALKDVVSGKLFGFISTVIDIGYVFQNSFVGQLKIAGKFDDTLNLKMAVRGDDEALLSVLNKAIRSISTDEEKKIINSYLAITYEQEFDYDIIIKIFFIILIFIAIGMYRHHILNKMNNTLKELAYKDQLTGLRNRHYFFDVIESIFPLAQRNDDAFSILLVDVDNFKNINDEYGHLIGDEVLKSLSASLQESIRQSDILARYGGEEFIIALPNTASNDAMKVAEHICQNIEESQYKNETETIATTVSIGVCDYYDEKTIEALINNADVALYKAKQEGKNRAVEFRHRYSLNAVEE